MGNVPGLSKIKSQLASQYNARQMLGRRGERAAVRFLDAQGYFVWKANWKCRRGELDIVAYQGHQLVILEVKSASSSRSVFDPLDRIDHRKRLKLRRLAERFMKDHRVELKARRLWSVRIDAIRVTASGFMRSPHIEHYQNSVEFR